MKSLCDKGKYFVTLVLFCIVSLMPGGVMCAPPPGAGAGQQICQSGPCVDSVAIIDGQVNTQDLAVGAVGSAQIQADAVDGVKVLDGSLTGVDIQDGSIGSADIAPGAIGTNQLSDGAVTGVKVQAGSITGAHIQDGAVGAADVAPGVIGTAHLSNDSVTGAKVLDGSLTGADVQDGSIGSGDIATGAVGTAHLSDGAVTGAKVQAGSLTGAHMQDGSIDSTKVGFNFAGSNSKGGPALDLTCVGCVSKSELDFAIPGSAARRVVVAASGGDYTTISAALAAINPSATEPYVIDIMPGAYFEKITMKSYVHLRGAGREVATVQYAHDNVIVVRNCTNVAITGLRISGGWAGVYVVSSSSVRIMDNSLSGNTTVGVVIEASSPTVARNIISNNQYGGVGIQNGSSPIISGNQITGQPFGAGVGIAYSSSPIITDNVITGNYGQGIYAQNNSSPIIRGNTIVGNDINGLGYNGIMLFSTSMAKITHNIITNNGGPTVKDIYVSPDSKPNISFNVYDTITGTTGVGMYNVNSNGDPAPAP